MSSTNNDLLTCVTCNVAFKDPELHRTHFKSDWHRYNLKRKVAELAPIGAQDFAERVRIQNAQIENAQNQEGEEMFCKLCSKHFQTANAFTNHKQSKKHKEMEATLKCHKLINNINKNEPEAKDDEIELAEEEVAVKSDRMAKKLAQLQEELQKNQDVNMEEETGGLDENEWEDIGDEDLNFDESKIIPLTQCLFCAYNASSVEEKCEHMAKEHSFFIPDLDYVSDMEGLMKHLGMKLGVYHVCLWCSSKCYGDLLSVQKHMLDKGHTKMKFQGETLLEYADYYTYEGDTTIDEEYDIIDSDAFDSTKNSSGLEEGVTGEDAAFELVLPSGVKVGHRSLFKYYKQSFGHRNLQLKQFNNQTIKDKYRAIANGGVLSYHTELQKQRKDLAYFKRWSAKMHAKLGWETNKLQKHFRRQNITF